MKNRNIILIALMFSGLSAMTYEVVWTRAISLVIGSTTYAISTMLAAFMAGLSLGGFLGGKLADLNKNNFLIFGILEFSIGICSMLTFILVTNISPFYSFLYNILNLNFYFFSVIQFIFVFIIMMVPTTLMGMTFPLVLKERASSIDIVGREAGDVYAVNSVGAVFGALSAGFVLIPVFGLLKSNIIAASMNVMIALFIFYKCKISRKYISLIIFFPLVLVLAATSYGNTKDELKYNFYIAQRFESYDYFKNTHLKRFETLYSEEGPHGRVQVLRDTVLNAYSISSNGRFEGSIMKHEEAIVEDGSKDMNTFLLSAYLPLAALPDANSLLTIGLGTGTTLRAAASHDSLEEIVSVEINGHMNDAVKQYFYPELFEDPRIEHVVADGRNYLSLVDRKFDIITSLPSYPTDAGAVNLFTAEFYQLVSDKLSEEGVFSHWIPGNMLTQEDMDMMINTLDSVFNYVYGWKLNDGDFIFICSNNILEKTGEYNKLIESMPLTSQLSGMYKLILNPEQVKMVSARSGKINSDMTQKLEFIFSKKFLGY